MIINVRRAAPIKLSQSVGQLLDEEIKTTSFEKNMYGEMAQPLYEVLELGFPFIDRFETDYCLIDYINSEAVAMLEEEDVKQREKETEGKLKG